MSFTFCRVTTAFLMFLFSSLSFAQQSQSELIEKYFDIIKSDHSIGLADQGPLCEKIAIYQIEQEFDPNEYTTLNGLVYEEGDRIVGELDVVVIRNDDSESVLVAEVKCWNRPTKALQKANQQLSRFFSYLDDDIDIYSAVDFSESYSTSCFDEAPEIRTISQKGTAQFGFDQELELSLNSVKILLKKLQCERELPNVSRACRQTLNK